MPSIGKTLHTFLTLLLSWTLLPKLTFYQITRGLHRPFETGAVCQKSTPGPVPLSDFHVFQFLMNLSCFRTIQFRISLGTSVLLFIILLPLQLTILSRYHNFCIIEGTLLSFNIFIILNITIIYIFPTRVIFNMVCFTIRIIFTTLVK